jgi:multiple sugar transport system substrate-binding protein
LASAGLLAAGLAACGTSTASTGPVTLNYYLYPDNSGATQTAIKNCDQQSGGKYTISYQKLPNGSDGQRQQLVRRMAAHDPTIDIMGLDVTWEAEFAQAGWAAPWPACARLGWNARSSPCRPRSGTTALRGA